MQMLTARLIQLQLPEPIAIVGAGVTGRSCFDLLQSAQLDCRVFDERGGIPKAFSEQADKVVLGAFDETTFADVATILLSPGVDTRRPCFAEQEEKLLTDIELFARLTDKTIIGVTGSNGKSTVVSLLHQVTQHAGRNYVLCGNIGLPVLQALRESETDCEGYIVELSSYHLERAPTLCCEIGVWLNVSPDHLDRYDSYDDYVAAKARLFAQSKQIIANIDDKLVKAAAKPYTAPTWFSQFNQQADYYLHQQKIINKDGKVLFAMADFAQLGNHYGDDVMAVFAVAEKLGIAEQITAQACKNFVPLASRSVVVGEKHGVTFINDSKGTNVGATAAAINGLERPIILIAGGQGKGQDFSELATAGKNKLKAVFLIGEAAPILYPTLATVAPCEVLDSLEQAVNKAIMTAQHGDVVLLSPACASFDMFESYLVRGEVFEQLVKEYVNE